MHLLNFTKFATLACCLMTQVCTSRAWAKTCVSSFLPRLNRSARSHQHKALAQAL